MKQCLPREKVVTEVFLKLATVTPNANCVKADNPGHSHVLFGFFISIIKSSKKQFSHNSGILEMISMGQKTMIRKLTHEWEDQQL